VTSGDLSANVHGQLDLAIAVPMTASPRPIASLDGWTQHEKMKHPFFSADGQMVLLPRRLDG